MNTSCSLMLMLCPAIAPPAPIADDKPTAPYRIELSLLKTDYAQGESLQARIRLTNIADVPITVSDPHRGQSALSLGFVVRDLATGKTIHTWDRSRAKRTHQGGVVRIEHRQAFAVSDPVFMDGLVPAAQNQLPPGRYALIAAYTNRQTRIAQYAGRRSWDYSTRVESEPLAFVVTGVSAAHQAELRRFESAWAFNRPLNERIDRVRQILPTVAIPDLRARLLIRQARLERLQDNNRAAALRDATSIRLLEEAEDLGTIHRPSVNLLLGELYLEAGNFEEAAARLRRSPLARAAFILKEHPALADKGLHPSSP